MGNNCVGQRTSKDGLFASASSSFWWPQSIGGIFSPTSREIASEAIKDSNPKASQDFQNRPPEVVKIDQEDIKHVHNTAYNQELKPSEPEKEKEKENKETKSDEPVRHREETKPAQPAKAKKLYNTKRLESYGLQADSVLQTKTGHLKEHYNLGKKLGKGQYGTTFLCVEKDTGKKYACKSMAKRKLLTSEDVEDVRREIQIMHHLTGSPDVISIKGAYEDAVAVHVVMDLCAGGELFDRIVQRGHYTERKAAKLARTIVSVVQGCHSLGVMHRDLKPENFLFVNEQEDSPLKAIDFGLSVFFKPGLLND